MSDSNPNAPESTPSSSTKTAAQTWGSTGRVTKWQDLKRDQLSFLAKVFANKRPEEQIIVARATQFKDTDDTTYPAYPIDTEIKYLTHFNLSTVGPEASYLGFAGRPRLARTNDHCFATHLICLDDVGAKSARPSLPESYEIETRPGNSQLGYVFDRPCTDFVLVNSLIASLIAAGYSDPGATGHNRLVRLPGSKPSNKPHRAKLVHFDGPRYDPEALFDLFGVERVYASSGSPRLIKVDPDLLSDDPMLAWLQETGVLMQTKANGWHRIYCPWYKEHSDGDLSGTHYKSPTPGDAHRSFTCKHGHCRHRTWSDFLTEFRAFGAPVVPISDDAAIRKMKARIKGQSPNEEQAHD